MEILTWKCHICGETRPDDKISVLTKTNDPSSPTIQQNIRYCNDNLSCIDGAKDFTFFSCDTGTTD